MMIMIFLWEFRVELIFHNYLLTLTIHDLNFFKLLDHFIFEKRGRIDG